MSRPPDTARPTLSLTETAGGIAVVGLTLLVLLYSLIAVGNILLGVLLSLLLVGGYLFVQLLQALLSLAARLVEARERETRAAEVQAAVAAESTDIEFNRATGTGFDRAADDSASEADVSGERNERETDTDEEWAD